MKNALAKIALYLYPLNLKFAGIFNLADLLIIKSGRLSLGGLYAAGVFLLLMILSAFQIIFYNRSIEFNIMYVPVKLAIIFLYFGVYFKYSPVRISKAMVYIAFFPLVVSILGLVSPNINALVNNFYGLTESETWRYGGIFGQDVNSLGMYSTLSLILLYLSKDVLRLNFLELIFGVLFCLICIIVSGMRAGLIALVVTLFLIYFLDEKSRNEIIRSLLYALPAIFCILLLTSLFIDEKYYALLQDRFSFDSLLGDFDADGDGNLAVAINYFHSVVGGEFDAFAIIFGYDSSLIFVDNFFVFVFVKYGIVGLVLTFLYFIYAYRRAKEWGRINNSIIGLFFVVYTMIISLKGIFPLAGYYLYLITISISIISQKNYKIKCVEFSA